MASPDRFQPLSRLAGFFNRNKIPADPGKTDDNKQEYLVDESGRFVEDLNDQILLGEITCKWPLTDVNGNILTRSNKKQEVVPNQDENNPLDNNA